jgi:hypothetical protein
MTSYKGEEGGLHDQQHGTGVKVAQKKIDDILVGDQAK